jgi:hypothetical protein
MGDKPKYDSTLARMAGNIAAGMVGSGSGSVTVWQAEGRSEIAETSVSLARQIIERCYAVAPAPDVDARVIADAVAHWHTQGGDAQFGRLDVPAENADGFVSAVLTTVRRFVDQLMNEYAVKKVK